MVRVIAIAAPSHDRMARADFEVTVGGTTSEIWFRASRDHSLEPSGDMELAMALPVAMATDGVLELDRPVSDELVGGLRMVQDILLSWYPELRRVTVTSPSGRVPRPRSRRGTLACFTGGVDSFYSVRSLAGELDGLLFVHGFDVPLDAGSLRHTVSRHLQEAATEMSVPLIEVETNLRELLDPYVDWGQIGHGPAIVAVASGLRRECSRLVIPSSHSYRDLFPWGSHPLLDPLWSSRALRVEHRGAEATRVDKIRSIALSPMVARHLRVCWQPGTDYNCGSCEKCVRTMVTLDLVGALSVSETFPHHIDLDVVARLPLRNENDASYLRENLDLARKLGATAYVAALEAAERQFLAGDV